MTPSLALSRSADQVHPDVFRSGEDDAVDVLVVDQLLARGAAAAGDEVEDAGGNPGLVHHLHQFVAEERRHRRRLEDDGVAGDERAARRPRGEREREVERRDDRPDAVRPHDARILFARPQCAELPGESVMLGELIAVVLDEIRRLLDVADAFEPVLAGFVSHQRRQLPAVIANPVRDFLQERDAVLPRAGAPRGEGVFRRLDRVADVLPAAALKPAEQDARVDRAAIVELGGGADVASADDHRIAPAERAFDAFDRRVQLAVQILHPIRSHRRVRDLLFRAFDVGFHQ
jgi:hypothetical protein